MVKNNFKELLLSKHLGFAGVTHWLIAILFFFLLWLIPTDISQQYISSISDKGYLFLFIIFLCIGGASLLPDLDSSPLQEGGSTAVYQLGVLGYLLSILFITISGVFYSVLHTKYDQKPKSQHRMLFHSPIVPIALFIYIHFFFTTSQNSISDMLKANELIYPCLMILFLSAISIYLGSSMLFYRIFKILKKQKYNQFTCLGMMILGTIYIATMPIEYIKLIGVSIALGYLFHIIGDMFSKGSSPLFFPIPVPAKLTKIKQLQFWKKPFVPFAIETGGIANTILTFILGGMDLFLLWYIFIRK